MMKEETITVHGYHFRVCYEGEEIDGIYRTEQKGKKANSPVVQKLESQLKEYWEGERKYFDVKLQMKGTDFQIACWKALLKIPYGETRSYQEIASMVGKEKACRAVGQAIHQNPFIIVVPCHRVISKNGSLGGYFYGEDMKRHLLEIEKSEPSHGIIDYRK